MLLWRFTPWVAIGSAALALVVVTVFLRYLSARVSVLPNDETIVWSDVGLARRTIAHRKAAVTLVVERSLPGFPWANLTLIGWAHSKFSRRCLVPTGDPYTELSNQLVGSANRDQPTGAEGND